MGLFSKKVTYPELTADNPAAKKIERIEAPLKDFAGKVADPLEVVAGDDHAYIFIGKPPKKFGLAVLEQDRFENLIALAQAKGLSNVQIIGLVDKLGDAYKNNADAGKFKKTIAGKDVVVIASRQLADQVTEVIKGI